MSVTRTLGGIGAAVLLASAFGQAQEPKALTDLQQAKARIVQLESANAKVSAENAVLTARLAILAQQQQDTTAKATIQALDKEAGCSIDWTAIPPTCQS